MEHIINSQVEGIDFKRYLAYVDSIRHKLPAHVYAFASDARYFDLGSPSSLHDSWLETLTVRETVSGECSEIRKLEIHVCLLGQFHDRRIHLRYKGVTCYRFDTPRNDDFRYQHTAHGNLFTHEIRLSVDGFLRHELLFERAVTFLIECTDLTHSEEMIHATL